MKLVLNFLGNSTQLYELNKHSRLSSLYLVILSETNVVSKVKVEVFCAHRTNKKTILTNITSEGLLSNYLSTMTTMN